MVTRSQFIRGFYRLQGIAHCGGILAWVAVAIVWALFVYNSKSTQFWPYQRIYEDSATLLFVFICLGGPLFSFLFSAPIYVVRFIASGFTNLDDEGIPESEWKLYCLFTFLEDAVSYLLRVFAWIAVLGILYVVDTEQNTRAVLTFVASNNIPQPPAGFVLETPISWQIFAHAIVLVTAIGLRVAFWIVVGIRFQVWLDEFFTNRLLGKERSEALVAYCQKIADRGWFPVIQRLLSTFTK